MIDLPPTLRDLSAVHTSLFLLNNIPHILAVTSSGRVLIVSIEGEEQFRKSLFAEIDWNEYPVTACRLYAIDQTSEVLNCVVTTLGHGVYHCSLDLKNDNCSAVQLASPSLPITSLTVLQSDVPKHITRSQLQESAVKGLTTLVTVLSDSTVLAYDLTANTRNFEYSILSWLMPLVCIRDMNVITAIVYCAKDDVFLMGNKDYLVYFKCNRQTELVEFSAGMKHQLLHEELSHFSRLLQ